MIDQRVKESIWGVPGSPEFSAVQRLLQEFQARESDEQRWLSGYQKITERSNDPLIRFLLNLIIADEQRHHELIDRMVSSLKDDLASTPPQAAVSTKNRPGKKSRKLLSMITRFIDVERTGIKEYRKLNRVSQGLRHDLFGLICKTMIHDSLKHIAILEFLRLTLRGREPSPRKRERGANPS